VLAAGLAGLFLSGALAARFPTRSVWRSGLRQVGLGAIAAVATYLVGALIGIGVR